MLDQQEYARREFAVRRLRRDHHRQRRHRPDRVVVSLRLIRRPRRLPRRDDIAAEQRLRVGVERGGVTEYQDFRRFGGGHQLIVAPLPQALSIHAIVYNRAMLKKLLIAVAVVVVLIVAVLLGILFYVDSIAKVAIERGGTAALGTPTTVDGVSIKILAGQGKVSGLQVANPPGGAAKNFLKVGDASAEVAIGSLTSDVVKAPKIEINHVEMTLEKKGKQANYEVILDNLKRVKDTTSGGSQPAPEGQKPAKKFLVEQIVVRDIKVHVDMNNTGIGGKLTELDVEIPEIKIDGFGSDKPLDMEQLTGIVTKAVFQAIAKKAGGVLPAELIGSLNTGLAGLGNLGSQGVEVLGGTVKEAGKVVADLTKGVGQAVGEVGKGLGEAGKGVTEGLGGVFKGIGGALGGDKKDGEKKEEQK